MDAPIDLSQYAAIDRARLPRWLLPDRWPQPNGAPALATIEIRHSRVTAVKPSGGVLQSRCIDVAGALVLPGLFEPHAHIDKAYTRSRIGRVEPGLLGAIDAASRDRHFQTAADIRSRARRALEDAERAGVTRLRTHIDWPDTTAPLAWEVLGELAEEWRERIRVERIALLPLPMFAWRDRADAIAGIIRASRDAWLGAFIHTANYDARALEILIRCAADAGVGLDLHVDEELAPAAQGLAGIVAHARIVQPARPIVCSHVCALAALPERDALAVLDAVAAAPITLVTLPRTNLLLQDAQTGRTPRQRGITLVKEAHARGIPVLIGSDNVQDAFCAYGSHDPVESLRLAAITAQLDDVFDIWSAAICRTDWIDGIDSGDSGDTGHSRDSGDSGDRSGGCARGGRTSSTLIGTPAALTVFEDTDVHIWPEAGRRSVLRAGDISDAPADAATGEPARSSAGPSAHSSTHPSRH